MKTATVPAGNAPVGTYIRFARQSRAAAYCPILVKVGSSTRYT
jgi:hypothetical protein